MHSSFQGQIGSHGHVINQSLKPKMIMNNNHSNMIGGAVNLNQHQGHSGDNMRPNSSKTKKKTT